MILLNANIFTRDCIFEIGNVYVKDENFERLEFNNPEIDVNDEVIDCNGLYLVPGFIDVHFHGCGGYDFCDANKEALDAITNYQLQNGMTSICPATMTFPKEKLLEIMKCVCDYKNGKGSQIVGINMEGPFISSDKVGAQNPEYVQEPDFKMLQELQEASGGLIKLVDIAPEVNGAIDFIKKASKDFVISIAHTNCDYDTAKLAYECGARHLTHTFNAMPGIHHRKPGPIVAAAEFGAFAEIICDGQHVDYAAVRFAFNMFKNRICLISDSCEATGLDNGQYSLGGQAIIKSGNRVVLKNNQDTIAASATNMFDCFKHAVEDANIPLETAIASATINPAKSINIDLHYGSIEPGKFADFLLLDKSLNLIDVFKLGKKVNR